MPNTEKEKAPLPVPRIITILQRCVTHGIQDSLISHLHYNDLQLLLMSLDIDKVREAIKAYRRAKMRSHGVEDVQELSASEAVKFLKGGG